MSNIDYTQICPEFYTNYEDGCCMENCTFESKGYCPVQYVKGLLEEKDKVIEQLIKAQHQLKVLEKALELACDKIAQIFESHYSTAWFYDSDENIVERDKFEEYFKTKAKEMK